MDKARPGRYPSRANDHGKANAIRSALRLRRSIELVGKMFRRSSAAVATSREGQRSPRSGREGQHRLWDRCSRFSNADDATTKCIFVIAITSTVELQRLVFPASIETACAVFRFDVPPKTQPRSGGAFFGVPSIERQLGGESPLSSLMAAKD